MTLWQTETLESATELAEAEAEEYARDTETAYRLKFAQAYHLFDTPGSGAEIFSLARDSDLDRDAYIDTFFDTGRERQRHLPTE